MEILENNLLNDVMSAEQSKPELDDVDALIQQLEARFQGSHMLAEEAEEERAAPGPITAGCTLVARCTGTCPCVPPVERE